jgi:hypothetical protein
VRARREREGQTRKIRSNAQEDSNNPSLVHVKRGEKRKKSRKREKENSIKRV